MTLEGRTIALAEGRQLEELAQMLEKEGAATDRCPMFSILDPADDGPALEWLDRLLAGSFQWIVLLTGEGLRRLLACAERHGKRDAVVEALAKTPTITRGPKPVQALRALGLTPSVVTKIPTTDGVIAAMRELPLHGATVGVQLYSGANLPLTGFLEAAGATVHTVQPYVYAPASDADRVVALIEKMAAGKIDAIVFTSSPQVDRLFEVAHEKQLAPALMKGLQRTLVASVGPVINDTLSKRGVEVHLAPDQGFVMKNLVQLIKRRFDA